MNVNLPKLPWWLWVMGFFVLMRVVDELAGVLAPIAIFGFILYVVLGKSRGRRPGIPGPPGPPAHPAPPTPLGAATPNDSAPYDLAGGGLPGQAPSGQQMPRIDVPRYPGTPSAPAPGSFTATPQLGASGSDPVVSLGRLQIAQAGRDLVEARAVGNEQRISQVITRLGMALDQVHQALAVSGRADRAMRSAVDRLRSDVAKAAEQAVAGSLDGALASRIAASCEAIGQTG